MPRSRKHPFQIPSDCFNPVLKQQERGCWFRLRNGPLLNLAERERDIEKEVAILPSSVVQVSLLPFYKFAKLRHSPVVIFSIVFPSKPPFLTALQSSPWKHVTSSYEACCQHATTPDRCTTGMEGSKGIFQGEIMNREPTPIFGIGVCENDGGGQSLLGINSLLLLSMGTF